MMGDITNVYLLIFTVILKKSTSLDRALLMVGSGGQVNLEQVWRTPGSLNDPTGMKHTWDTFSLTRGGNFRSSLIDEWSSDPPSKVSINLYNTQGDIMWWIRFNSSSSNMDVSSWMDPANVLDSASDIKSDMVTWQMDKLKFQSYLSPKYNYNAAWFAVWNGEVLTQDYPVFLFSIHHNTPHLLLETDFEFFVDYRGCWPRYHLEREFVKEDQLYMTLEMCNEECIAAKQPFILIERQYKCWCGNFKLDPRNRFDAMCEAGCPGNPLQTCGRSENMHAVYPIQQIQVPEIPMQADVWKTLDIDSAHTELMVNISEFSLDPKFPGYINGISMHLSDDSNYPGFYLEYNQWNCTNHGRKAYIDTANNKMVFRATNGSFYDIEIIPVRCMWIVFTDTNFVTSSTAKLRIYRPKDLNFATSPALIITGHWDTDGAESTPVSELSKATRTPTRIEETSTTEMTETSEKSEPRSTTPEVIESTVLNEIQETSTQSASTMDVTEPTAIQEISTELTENTAIQNEISENSKQGTTATEPRESKPGEETSVASQQTCICLINNKVLNISVELQEHIEEIQKNLTVNKTKLSSHIRKLTSASDNRISAQRIGYVGATFLTITIGFIIFIDLMDMFKVTKKKTSTRKKSQHVKNI